MSTISKVIRQYFVTCKVNSDTKETFQVNKRMYNKDDISLLKYLQRQSNKTLEEIERRFTTDSAYFMKEDDFIKFADKGRLHVTPSGKQRILPVRKEGEWYVKETDETQTTQSKKA